MELHLIITQKLQLHRIRIRGKGSNPGNVVRCLPAEHRIQLRHHAVIRVEKDVVIVGIGGAKIEPACSLQLLKSPVQYRVHGNDLVYMAVYIIHILYPSKALIRGEQLVCLYTGIGVDLLQPFIDSGGFAAAVGEIVAQKEALAAAALFRGDLHFLPAGILAQQCHDT